MKKQLFIRKFGRIQKHTKYYEKVIAEFDCDKIDQNELVEQPIF